MTWESHFLGKTAEAEWGSAEQRSALPRPRWPGQCWVGRGDWQCWAAGAVAGGHPGGERPAGAAERREAGHGALHGQC